MKHEPTSVSLILPQTKDLKEIINRSNIFIFNKHDSQTFERLYEINQGDNFLHRSCEAKPKTCADKSNAVSL